jgi:hypothetical protein
MNVMGICRAYPEWAHPDLQYVSGSLLTAAARFEKAIESLVNPATTIPLSRSVEVLVAILLIVNPTRSLE